MEPLGGKVREPAKPRGEGTTREGREPKGVQTARHTPPKTFKKKGKKIIHF